MPRVGERGPQPQETNKETFSMAKASFASGLPVWVRIKLAKQRRQIIVVTHNPNLAVVADADQVITASIDKKKMCRVTYVSGALENPTVNQHVVRYLEGTLPAFMNRDEKYIRST